MPHVSPQSICSCSLLEVARELIRLCGSKLVAITNGEKESVLATRDSVSEWEGGREGGRRRRRREGGMIFVSNVSPC